MKIITVDNEKRYCFEQGEALLRRKFEEQIAASEDDFARIVLSILAKLRQQHMDAWREAALTIQELDPEVDGHEQELSYNWFRGEFYLVKKVSAGNEKKSRGS